MKTNASMTTNLKIKLIATYIDTRVVMVSECFWMLQNKYVMDVIVEDINSCKLMNMLIRF
jgi:hypothetical protein